MYTVTYIANNTQTDRQSSRPGYNVTYIAKKYTDLWTEFKARI